LTKKIAIFIDNDFYFSILFLKRFFKRHSSSNFIIFLGNDFLNIRRIFIIFFSLSLLKFIRISIKIFTNKNSRILENFLKNKKIEFYPINNINSNEVQKILKKNNIKIIFSVINSKIFKKKYYLKYKIFNLHLGKIPEYKGIVPVINAIIKREKVLFSSIFLISFKGIDTGKVIFENYIRKKNTKDIFDLYTKLYQKGFSDLIKLSNILLLEKKIKIIKNIKTSEGNYYKYPSFINVIKISKYFNI
jgi:folate-dependent phosphoribosylglycinamide formyltransferase PurN